MKSEQTSIEMPDFLPRNLQMDGPFLRLLNKYSEKKSAFEICSKPTVIYFSEEGGKIQGCLHLVVCIVTPEMFGQPTRGQPDVYVMFQGYFYDFSDNKSRFLQQPTQFLCCQLRARFREELADACDAR